MGPIRIWKIIFGSGSEKLVVSSSKPQQRLLTTLTEYNLVNASLINHEKCLPPITRTPEQHLADAINPL